MIDYYLKTSPPWSICDLFKAGAMDTWERIRFSRTIPNLKIHETTITQNIIYELRLLQQIGKVRGLRIYEAKNEKANGADIELFVIIGKRAIGFPLQAKIIYHTSKKKHFNGDYRQMHHEVKKSGAKQIDLILKYAKDKGRVPLYLLYNYVNPGFSSVSEMKHYGCTLVSADFLKKHWYDPTGNLRKDIHFLDIHADHRTKSKPAFPWHELVCSSWATDLHSIIRELELPPSTLITPLTVDELLEDDSFSELTDGLTLTSRQARKLSRNRDKQIAELPSFNPKFRLLVDVGFQERIQ